MMREVVAAAARIKGWMTEAELQWLYEQACQIPGDIVELGPFEGRSTYALLSGAKGKVHVVDCFWCGTMHPEETERYTKPQFMQNCGHFPNLGVVFEGTTEEAAACPDIPQKVSAVFIDACHEEQYVLKDLELWAPRTEVLVMGHDLSPATPGVGEALQKYVGLYHVTRGPGSLWCFDSKEISHAGRE